MCSTALRGEDTAFALRAFRSSAGRSQSSTAGSPAAATYRQRCRLESCRTPPSAFCWPSRATGPTAALDDDDGDDDDGGGDGDDDDGDGDDDDDVVTVIVTVMVTVTVMVLVMAW